MRHPQSCVLALLLAAAPAVVQAQASDPAAAQISRFDDALIGVMKSGKQLGPQGRYDRLEPVIGSTFNLPEMTRFSVGPAWSTLSPAEQQALVKAFSRNTVASWAHNFDSYNGQRFTVGQVDTRGPDKLVRTQLLSPGSAPVNLVYRMRNDGGTWRVIDVYYNGSVSSLLGQRSEYATTLKGGGAPALVKKLDSHADQLLRSS
jgi:phospholipid transport system substrate-binding protein